MKNIKGRVENQVINQAWKKTDQVKYKVRQQIWDKLDRTTYNLVVDHMFIKIDNFEVKDHIRDHLEPEEL